MKLLLNSLFALVLIAFFSNAFSMDNPSAGSLLPLHAAMLNLDIGATKSLLEKKSVQINTPDKQGNTAYHILKAQQALIPLYALDAQHRQQLEQKVVTLNTLLLKAGCNTESVNLANQTPIKLYSFLNRDIQRDTIIPKYAPIPLVKESLRFNNVPEKYISEHLTTGTDIDESDHNSIVISQIRGTQKIYLKLFKLNTNSSTQAQNIPIAMIHKTREKIGNTIDILHNFSTIFDQYLHWGKKIHTDDIKNNAWVHLVLSNLKFNVKDAQANIYAILMKVHYLITSSNDPRTYQEIIKSQEAHPAALIYLFFDDTDVCYHRCLHNAVNKDKFEDGFNRLNSKLK